MDLRFADEKADAIIQAWYPGARGGKTIAKILFGEISPSGKLPVTFYRDLLGMPDFTDYSMQGRTYRYLKNKPLYPFGYGLTYGKCMADEVKSQTEASYSDIQNQGVVLNVKVTNTGTFDTEDVLQVYCKVESPNEVDNYKLAAFKRISLKAGEKKEVEITVPPIAFTTVNENGERRADGTGATLYIGFAQPDERSQELTGMKSLILSLS